MRFICGKCVDACVLEVDNDMADVPWGCPWSGKHTPIKHPEWEVEG